MYLLLPMFPCGCACFHVHSLSLSCLLIASRLLLLLRNTYTGLRQRVAAAAAAAAGSVCLHTLSSSRPVLLLLGIKGTELADARILWTNSRSLSFPPHHSSLFACFNSSLSTKCDCSCTHSGRHMQTHTHTDRQTDASEWQLCDC